MFGQSKPVAFEPYGRRRNRGRIPRWLVLLLCGIAVGAGGLFYVQERYLPPRLSPRASTELRSAFVKADGARIALEATLGETGRQLAVAVADRKKLTDELAASQPTVQALRADLAAVIEALPADPRGGAVAIRAGRLAAKGGTLSYDLIVTRERGSEKPLAASLRLAVAGETARGALGNFTAPAQGVSIGNGQVLRGSVALPDGFRPRQATVQIVDAAGKGMGMRVLRVQ